MGVVATMSVSGCFPAAWARVEVREAAMVGGSDVVFGDSGGGGARDMVLKLDMAGVV
jgi:hypothetical protein